MPPCHPGVVDQLDFALLVLRLALGLTIAMHGYNKFFGGGRLPGTARWFESMGVRPGRVNAVLAASTEVVAGLGMAAGLLTPLSAAGIIALMLVAITVSHRKNGFFIFRPGEGWEYCAFLATAAFAIATIGPGRWSLDNALGLGLEGWWGAAVAAVVAAGGRGAAVGRLLPATDAGPVWIVTATQAPRTAAGRSYASCSAASCSPSPPCGCTSCSSPSPSRPTGSRTRRGPGARRAGLLPRWRLSSRLCLRPGPSPTIEPVEEALRQRADVGEQATDLLAEQVARLRSLPPPGGEADGKLLQTWLADWDTYLSDRRDHIEGWRAGSGRSLCRDRSTHRRADRQPDGRPGQGERHAELRRAPRPRLTGRRGGPRPVGGRATAQVTGFQPSPSTWRRMTRAGAPAATQRSGSSPTTTELAPTTTWRADAGARQHHRAEPQPRPGAHHHRTLGHDLAGDRQIEVLVPVVLVRDVDVVAGPDVVADLDRQVPDDAAPLADQAAITDRHHAIRQAALPGHHAGRQT